MSLFEWVELVVEIDFKSVFQVLSLVILYSQMCMSPALLFHQFNYFGAQGEGVDRIVICNFIRKDNLPSFPARGYAILSYLMLRLQFQHGDLFTSLPVVLTVFAVAAAWWLARRLLTYQCLLFLTPRWMPCL